MKGHTLAAQPAAGSDSDRPKGPGVHRDQGGILGSPSAAANSAPEAVPAGMSDWGEATQWMRHRIARDSKELLFSK